MMLWMLGSTGAGAELLSLCEEVGVRQIQTQVVVMGERWTK